MQVLVDEMKLVDTKSNREEIFPEQFPERVILRVKEKYRETYLATFVGSKRRSPGGAPPNLCHKGRNIPMPKSSTGSL